jgi:hypothetical protein
MKPRFNVVRNGLEINDPIERYQCRIEIDGAVAPEPLETNPIPYPIDNAVKITVDSFKIPNRDTVYVYDGDGSVIGEISPQQRTTLPYSEYLLDVFEGLKVYIKVESSIRIWSDNSQTHIDLDRSTEIIIGVRSLHRRPGGKITTTAEPTDVMEAVSAFGSALKTRSPERSYPTLRGHPPELEIGDELNIPSEFKKDPTGIRIEVPPVLEQIYVVTPLAYYLGADVVPNSDSKIIVGSNYEYSLYGEKKFEEIVGEVLKQTVFLDCVVRTEGSLLTQLSERSKVEPILEFNIKSVYEQSLEDQVKVYLDVSFAEIESFLPQWCESELQGVPEAIPFLPFLANKLSTIRTSSESHNKNSYNIVRKDENFECIDKELGLGYTTFTNKLSISQHWESSNSLNTKAEAPLSAFYNNINRTPRKGPIEIEVVCNDQAMTSELITVYGTYGDRKELPFDVNIHHELAIDELKDVFNHPSDFVHYIGHIEEEGFRCRDGYLDAWSLETVGSKAFLLNACRSYSQGLALVEAGSIGGITTLEDINNKDAVCVGSTIAKLLNQGFPLYGAIDIAQKEIEMGEKYLIVGNGMTKVAQPNGALPIIFSLDEYKNTNEVTLNLYGKPGTGIGTVYQPHIASSELHYLAPKEIGPISVTKPQLTDFLDMGGVVALLEDKVRIGENIGLKEL